jgi:hypothetical protein
MRTQWETLLIDALLDRLGSAQANALLAQLSTWMPQGIRDTRKGPAKAERRRADIRTQNSQGITTSKTLKDQPS